MDLAELLLKPATPSAGAGDRTGKGNGATPAIDGGKLDVASEEPLKRELADFVEAVRENRPPGVTGADGMRALELAQKITDEMKRQG